MATIVRSSKLSGAAALPRRSLADLLAPLEQLAAHSPNLVVKRDTRFSLKNESVELPRYLFIGPGSGDTPIRIGIFAAIHGDEPEGAYALVHLLKSLEANPELAAGYCLSLYPVCNPTGFADNTRQTRNGCDLNREFWQNSRQPEIQILEAELTSQRFDGIISLHTHEAGSGFYGLVRSLTLTRHLLEPALQAAEAFLPRDERAVINGLPARNSMVRDAAPGALSAPPNSRPRPFEITLEMPKAPPAYLKEFGLVVALQTILTEYRKLIAYAPNI